MFEDTPVQGVMRMNNVLVHVVNNDSWHIPTKYKHTYVTPTYVYILHMCMLHVYIPTTGKEHTYCLAGVAKYIRKFHYCCQIPPLETTVTV